MVFVARLIVLYVLGVLAVPLSSRRLQVRLKNGKEPYMGIVEVFYRNKWGEICDNGWNLMGARVVCRMLGYPDATRFTFGDWFGRGRGEFWLDHVKCDGTEDTLVVCARSDWGRVKNCRSSQVAGVVCRQRDEDVILKPVPAAPSRKVIDLPVRLLSRNPVVNDYVTEGILQVMRHNQWGYVCSKNWRPENARVACGMLGFKNFKQKAFNPPIYQSPPGSVYLLGDVHCAGEESSLVECAHSGWGPLKCDQAFPIYIACIPYTPLIQPDNVRLRSGAQLWEGRVEVRSIEAEEVEHWGAVCDDYFDMVDGNVVCRSLGYGTASRVYHNAWYGQNVGKVYMDDVECSGKEEHLSQCQHRTERQANCNHYEDVGVKCNAPQLYNHQLRLSGGYNEMEGRVEVFVDNQWGTVCGDSWDLDAAIVVCRQLHLGFAKEAVKSNIFGATSLEEIMFDVKCKGDERSLYHCKHSKKSKYKNGKKGGVICSRRLPDLVVNVDELGNNEHYRIERIALSQLSCAFEENCLASSAHTAWKGKHKGYRNLLRFTSRIENRGLTHFKPHMEKSQWQWHDCHNHYHSMEVFSTYDLVGKDGIKIAEGHKASFCLEDTVCDAGITKLWNCTGGADQGVSPNCYDVYKWNIDCQWIDVTDLAGYGTFHLRIAVNPGRIVAETDYDNNIGVCEAYYYGSLVILLRCHLEHCKSKMRTTGGNGFGECCVFPFTLNGTQYRTCTTGRPDQPDRPWCPTTRNYTRDHRWGYCA